MFHRSDFCEVCFALKKRARSVRAYTVVVAGFTEDISLHRSLDLCDRCVQVLRESEWVADVVVVADRAIVGRSAPQRHRYPLIPGGTEDEANQLSHSKLAIRSSMTSDTPRTPDE